MNRLNECEKGDHFSIKYLDGTEKQKRHLQNLGFIPSSIIIVVNKVDDNMIIQVFNARIAINREISDLVYGTIIRKEDIKVKNLSQWPRMGKKNHR